MGDKYTYKGQLKNGESIFVDKAAALFIEKDHQYLVEATSLEIAEARKKVNQDERTQL